MRISKVRDPEEAVLYRVFRGRGFWWRGRPVPLLGWEQELKNVVEADDDTGQVVQQVVNERGEAIFTNASEDIALTDAVRLLLLNPELRRNFQVAGFRPKITQTFFPYIRLEQRRGRIAAAEQHVMGK